MAGTLAQYHCAIFRPLELLTLLPRPCALHGTAGQAGWLRRMSCGNAWFPHSPVWTALTSVLLLLLLLGALLRCVRCPSLLQQGHPSLADPGVGTPCTPGAPASAAATALAPTAAPAALLNAMRGVASGAALPNAVRGVASGAALLNAMCGVASTLLAAPRGTALPSQPIALLATPSASQAAAILPSCHCNRLLLPHCAATCAGTAWVMQLRAAGLSVRNALTWTDTLNPHTITYLS
jgi:hypothetical protein